MPAPRADNVDNHCKCMVVVIAEAGFLFNILIDTIRFSSSTHNSYNINGVLFLFFREMIYYAKFLYAVSKASLTTPIKRTKI